MLEEANAKLLAEGVAREGPNFTLSKKGGAKIGFEAMAKTIAGRWRELSESELERYKALAAQEMEAYRKALKQYKLDKIAQNMIEIEKADAEEEAKARASQTRTGNDAPSASSAAAATTQLQPPGSGLLPFDLPSASIYPLASSLGSSPFVASQFQYPAPPPLFQPSAGFGQGLPAGQAFTNATEDAFSMGGGGGQDPNQLFIRMMSVEQQQLLQLFRQQQLWLRQLQQSNPMIMQPDLSAQHSQHETKDGDHDEQKDKQHRDIE